MASTSQRADGGVTGSRTQVEAASKSLSAPGDQDIRNVVEKIIASDIAENQFDECDGLTFKSLNVIASGRGIRSEEAEEHA